MEGQLAADEEMRRGVGGYSVLMLRRWSVQTVLVSS
jgi:hypothetical protein